MAWAMDHPKGFGKYWPNGEYEGWDKALTDYFNTKMPAEQKALFTNSIELFRDGAAQYCAFVRSKFSNEIGSPTDGSVPPLSPIERHEAPHRYRLERPPQSLASLIMMSGGPMAVEEPLKDLIEQLEPGIHFFSPIDIVTKRNKLFSKQYFAMAIGKFVDSLSPADSNPESLEESPYNEGEFQVRWYPGPGIKGLALSRSAVGNAHVWHERRLISQQLFFSDRLIDEVHKANLLLPPHYRVKEI